MPRPTSFASGAFSIVNFDKTKLGNTGLRSARSEEFYIGFEEFPVRTPSQASYLTNCNAHRYNRFVRLSEKARAINSNSHLLGRQVHTPESFEFIEFSDFGPENMNDYVAGINEHPITMG